MEVWLQSFLVSTLNIRHTEKKMDFIL